MVPDRFNDNQTKLNAEVTTKLKQELYENKLSPIKYDVKIITQEKLTRDLNDRPSNNSSFIKAENNKFLLCQQQSAIINTHLHLFKHSDLGYNSKISTSDIKRLRDKNNNSSLKDLLSMIDYKRTVTAKSSRKQLDTMLSEESYTSLKKEKYHTLNNDDIIKSGFITIQELDGNILNNQRIVINAGGVSGSSINRGGVIFFGTNHNDNTFVNDVCLNIANRLKICYLFLIYYKKSKACLIHSTFRNRKILFKAAFHYKI